jgi:hypothetical protein
VSRARHRVKGTDVAEDVRRARPSQEARLARTLGLALVQAAVTGGALPTLGRYVVEERIGAGGFGVVFRARDSVLSRSVAIKVLRQDDGDTPAAATLLDEARLLASVTSPHVVPIHDVGGDGDAVWIVLEWIEGLDLGQWIRQTPAPHWREVVRVMTEAGRGLAAAHAADVVHRDFKPTNVLVDRSGCAKVGDFGLALTLSSGSVASGHAGTEGYVAPELLRGDPASPASDQFAFGVSFRELLRLASAPPELVSVLEPLLRRATSPEPESRWSSVQALLCAVEAAVLEGEVAITRAVVDASRLASARGLLYAPGVGATGGDARSPWNPASGATVSPWVPVWSEAIAALASIVEDAPDRETYRREVLRLLDTLVGYDTILLGDAAAQGDAAPTIRDFDPEFVAQFRSDPGRYAPTLARLVVASAMDRTPVRDVDVYARSVRDKTPFYTELIGPKGSKVMAITTLLHEGKPVGTVQMSRTAIGTRFQDHELRLLHGLAPWLARGEAKFLG